MTLPSGDSLHVALPPSPHLLLFGHFWHDWMEGDLGTYQLAMMSCLFFFFYNKTEQNKTKNLDNCVWLVYLQLGTGI